MHPRPSRSVAAAARESEKLQKVLARRGLGSRREMEEWIAAGRIKVNDAPAHLGQRVAEGDRIRVDDRLLRARGDTAMPRVLLYHKPAGEIVSADDPEGRPTVFDRLPRVRGGRWVAVGRLDLTASGLLIFTTSGDLAARLMHPRYELEREYAVRIDGILSGAEQQRLVTGVALEDGDARFESVEDGGGEGRNHWYRVVLKEGRNREVRRLFATIGRTVNRLIRVRFGPLRLPPHLRRGALQQLDANEVATLIAALPPPTPLRRNGTRGRPPNRP